MDKYKTYILNWNIEKFDLIIKNNINMFFFIKTLFKTNQNDILHINFISSVKKITKNLE